VSTYYVDPDDDYEPEPYHEPQREAQPDDFCECRPGVEMRQRWQHAAECLRWSPPLAGPGSSDEHRAQALAHIRAQLAESKRRHQEEATRGGRR
jgi:hypothetical protein